MKPSKYIFLFLLVGLLTSCNDDIARLRDHGHETSATILGKSETHALKAKDRHCILQIGFFAQDSSEISQSLHQNDILKDTTMSMADRIDKWQPGGASFGEYTTLDLTVSRPVWDKYKEGDHVQIVYLPEDARVVRLKEQLD